MPSLLVSALMGLTGFGLTSFMAPKLNSAFSQSAQSPVSTSDIASGCPATTIASCRNSSAVNNLCCFESPGGLLLQTQFWDTNPATGPSDSWTIHGLWPDNCDSTFIEDCDPSRDYTDIAGLLTAQGGADTLSYMNTYWKNDPDDGTDEEFWEHEWATHGTCYSTLEPTCLPNGSPTGAEAVAFFETVVKLFQTLPTYTWLANQGITPAEGTTHTLASLTDALKKESGFVPALSCEGKALDTISWYFNVEGSLIDGTFVPIDAPEKGTCPTSGIEYLPKDEDDTDSGAKTPKKRPSRRAKRSQKHKKGIASHSEL
ncbi:ribonuclease T2 [Mycena maculata]|uniref:ribonuclease T2 n=1 Tax=Mycena maculata TaxID=230809 RepID=A0AAD7JVV5_9AGAR|nr:ribonuclease T2 [Mycena maculata]